MYFTSCDYLTITNEKVVVVFFFILKAFLNYPDWWYSWDVFVESRSKMPIRAIEHAMFSYVTHEALSRDNGHDINK